MNDFILFYNKKAGLLPARERAQHTVPSHGSVTLIRFNDLALGQAGRVEFVDDLHHQFALQTAFQFHVHSYTAIAVCIGHGALGTHGYVAVIAAQHLLHGDGIASLSRKDGLIGNVIAHTNLPTISAVWSVMPLCDAAPCPA